jgi:uncharacterized radical SAM protein YgiQ
MIHQNQNPECAATLVQKHGGRYLKVNPPALPFTTPELDALYALPFTRAPHPSYGEATIPAFEMIRHSVTAMRGCFGGCSFCALTVHQGRAIQSRSEESILAEVAAITRDKTFAGYISDIGGPTANMYQMVCGDREAEAVCRKLSCVHPSICSRLVTDHESQIALLRKAGKVPGVKKVFIASGVRYDLALRSDNYIAELAAHHVSGQLKVAPESADPTTLRLMRKPSIDVYDAFIEKFLAASKKAGKEQYVVPYFISAHPGCGLKEEVNTAEYLNARKIRPRQIQDFIPAPMTLAADMYHTGVDPMTGKPVAVDKGERARKLHRALIQYYKPENGPLVAEALEKAGRTDLLGNGQGCLVKRRGYQTRPVKNRNR